MRTRQPGITRTFSGVPVVKPASSSKRHTSSVNLYDETLLGSQLNAKGDINLQAAKDITLSASTVIEGHTFRDYINTYKDNAENAQLNAVVNALGLDKELLMALMADSVNDKNLNDFGRFDALKDSVNTAKARGYFEKQDGITIPLFKLNIRIDQFLKQFILAQTDDFLSDRDVVGDVMDIPPSA